MFAATENKTTVTVNRNHQNSEPAFFRKAGEETFFGSSRQPSFFNTGIQAKLSVSSPEDPQEKEADVMADRVMRMAEPGPVPVKEDEQIQRKEEEEEVQAKTNIQLLSRKCENCEEEEKVQAKHFSIHRSAGDDQETNADAPVEQRDENFEIQPKLSGRHRSDVIQLKGRGPPDDDTQGSFEQNLASTKGGGNALPIETREFMETRFNADFSGVRIHTGSYAGQMSSSINAQAFTHGNDIYFNTGKYSPQSESGGTLLAHELTHTLQQGASRNVATPKINHSTVYRKSQQNGSESGIDLGALSGGQQLSGDALDYLQDHFHTSLTDIRIFSNSEVGKACQSSGVLAIVQGRNIGITPSRYNIESESGALLVSEQVSKSLRQRGIRTTDATGNDNGGFAALLHSIKQAVLDNSIAPSETNKLTDEHVAGNATPEKKQVEGDETKQDTPAKKPKEGKTKRRSRKDVEPVLKRAKPQRGRSPKRPQEDPAFLRAFGKIKKTATAQKQHDPAEKKSLDAQHSADAVNGEAESMAQTRKTAGMGEAAATDKPFDSVSFKNDLKKRIESITPKTLEEANSFKENNNMAEVKSAMTEKVADEKQNTAGPVTAASEAPLQVNPGDNKQPLPLPPTEKGTKPAAPAAKDAAPKKKLDGEISMTEQSRSLDEEMKANQVTEGQLQSSNEPEFQQALDEKKSAQKDAVEKPVAFRKEEQLELKVAQTMSGSQATSAMAQMYKGRGTQLDATVKQQHTTKQKDEAKRAEVARTIEAEYKIAEKKVTTSLTAAETESNREFEEGAELARKAFEDEVGLKMADYKRRRYSGFWGGLKWAKDKIFGMPDAVNTFYKEARDHYIAKMDAVIDRVATIVTTHLNDAKQAITDGKKSIDKYVASLPTDLQSVGKEAAESIQDKFDSLEQSVNDKRNDLIDGLAQKYVDNVKKIDERIEAMKEANKGLIDKAIGFLKKVWKVIKDLVNLFTTILARLASIIGLILDSPGGFFENLGRAFNQGLNNFKNKFTEYLEIGLMEWLATNLGIKGFQIPEKFDAAGFFSLVLQVMGITQQRIRERAVKILGERKVALLEKAGGLLYKIYNEGLGVLWEMLVTKLSDLKDMVWEAIKSFIQRKIIEEAIKFVLSMLNPIGAFVKVCMAIYNFLMTLVRFKDKIVELLDTILNAVASIASGAVDAAAASIEKALAKSISIIIAFLAAVLGLNNIAGKVKEIILRIQKRVENAIDWIIGKAAVIANKVMDSALSVADKGKALVEKGTEKVVGVAKGAKDAILGWLGLKKKFTGGDGKPHEIFFEGQGENAVLIIKSDPTPYTRFLENYEKLLGTTALEVVDVGSKKKTKKDVIAEAKVIANAIEKEKRKKLATYPGVTDKEREAGKANTIGRLLTDLAAVSVPLFGAAKDKPKDEEIVVPAGANNDSFAETQEAKLIWKTPKVINNGSGPTSAKHAIYDKIDFRQKGDASYYIRGHLINDNLGGPGNWNNMTALSRTANHEHEEKVESKVKAAYDTGAVIRYRVTTSGKQNVKKATAADKDKFTRIGDFATALPYLEKITEAESQIPNKLTCESFMMKKVGDKWIDDTDKPIVTDYITFDVGDYSDYELGNLGGTVTLDFAKLKTEAATATGTFIQFKTQDKIHENSIKLLDAAQLQVLEKIFVDNERERNKKEELKTIAEMQDVKDITTWSAFATRTFFNTVDAAYTIVETAFRDQQELLRTKAMDEALAVVDGAAKGAFANTTWQAFKINQSINFKTEGDEGSDIENIENKFRTKQ